MVGAKRGIFNDGDVSWLGTISAGWATTVKRGQPYSGASLLTLLIGSAFMTLSYASTNNFPWLTLTLAYPSTKDLSYLSPVVGLSSTTNLCCLPPTSAFPSNMTLCCLPPTSIYPSTMNFCCLPLTLTYLSTMNICCLSKANCPPNSSPTFKTIYSHPQ